VRRGDAPTRLLAGAGLVLVLALQACGESGEQGAPAAAPTPAAEPEPAPAAAGVGESDTSAADAPGDAAAGATSYALFCASCHGADGGANTPIADSLKPRPTAHSNGTYMNTLSDDYLFRIIGQGGPAVGKSPLMMAWRGSLSDEQIRDVIAFIRTLADPPYQPPTP
jgi:cytochrome c1